MLSEIVLKTRTYRRFFEEKEIDRQELAKLVDLARLSGCSANKQSLRFRICTDRQMNEQICSLVGWAGALKEWPGPEAGERPSAYIAIYEDKELKAPMAAVDTGIAAWSMLLGATEKGLGGCMIASVNGHKLSEVLGIDEERYQFQLLIALGYPKETVSVVSVGEDGSTAYYRDEQQNHYVPKRSLDDVLI